MSLAFSHPKPARRNHVHPRARSWAPLHLTRRVQFPVAEGSVPENRQCWASHALSKETLPASRFTVNLWGICIFSQQNRTDPLQGS